MSSFSERLYRITRRHPTLNNKAKVAEHLGVSRSMLNNYENDNPSPPSKVLDKIVALEVSLGIEDSTDVERPQGSSNAQCRMVPIHGWAHAGQACGYEELPPEWRRLIPTDCRDPKAFGVDLEGDSMEDVFYQGDELVLMPSEQPYSGCFVVARFVDDGVVFRRFETMGKVIRLVPLNKRYPVTEHHPEEFSWIYPVWDRRTQLWKR